MTTDVWCGLTVHVPFHAPTPSSSVSVHLRVSRHRAHTHTHTHAHSLTLCIIAVTGDAQPADGDTGPAGASDAAPLARGLREPHLRDRPALARRPLGHNGHDWDPEHLSLVRPPGKPQHWPRGALERAKGVHSVPAPLDSTVDLPSIFFARSPRGPLAPAQPRHTRARAEVTQLRCHVLSITVTVNRHFELICHEYRPLSI